MNLSKDFWLILAGIIFATLYTCGIAFLGYRVGRYGVDALTLDNKQLIAANNSNRKVVSDLEKQIAEQVKQKEAQDAELATAASVLANYKSTIDVLQSKDAKLMEKALTKPQCSALKEHLCPDVLNY